ncbi:hypothetical protein PUW79_14760 [Microbacterium sp. NE2HP2]|uniref:hypothetical protein n=1 Tax=Microbacterium TaxID=33882 RepID=UPI0022AFA610|nr:MULTISPECIES: hypothetical protein [Microbacterium]MCZ4068628.1 hypothetical protein [Microbacterium sp. H37-C3]MDD7945901.1 hypothetical protein [Microbacterium plantarum]
MHEAQTTPDAAIGDDESSAPESVRRTGQGRRRGRRRLAFDLTAIGLLSVLALGALGVGGVAVYRTLYSPAAFVERYLSLLSSGSAADALRLPGVAMDSAELAAAELPSTTSEVLLRRAALAPLSEVSVIGERVRGDVTEITVTYLANGHRGRTQFDVEQDGWIGVAPAWRFAHSPLSAIDLTVRGATRFSVNGFELDTRQVAPEGVDADPLVPVSMLVFSPGAYSISVDTPTAQTPGVAVLSDAPQKSVPVDLQTEPTPEFIEVVQDRVDEFLASCATQQVLQPTGCPFGYFVRNRVEGAPQWSIAQNPEIEVVPDGAQWAIPSTRAVAHIDVDIRSIYDGRLNEVSEDVEFFLTGKITILPDGTASIQVSADQG